MRCSVTEIEASCTAELILKYQEEIVQLRDKIGDLHGYNLRRTERMRELIEKYEGDIKTTQRGGEQ